MSQTRQRNGEDAAARRRSKRIQGVAFVLVLGAIAAMAYALARQDGRRAARPGAAVVPAATNDTGGAEGSAARPAGFEKLEGRWQRPDGGYVLAVSQVEPNGTVTAAYFNPQPISVPRARATEEGGEVKLFVELRGPGYPGSTYNLTYHAGRDELEGAYFQAAMGEYYDVVFVRMK